MATEPDKFIADYDAKRGVKTPSGRSSKPEFREVMLTALIVSVIAAAFALPLNYEFGTDKIAPTIVAIVIGIVFARAYLPKGGA